MIFSDFLIFARAGHVLRQPHVCQISTCIPGPTLPAPPCRPPLLGLANPQALPTPLLGPTPLPPSRALPTPPTAGAEGPVGPGAGGIRTHDDDDMRASRTYFQNAALASNQRARLQTQKVIRADIFIDPNRYSYRSKHILKHIYTYLKQISKHINTYQLGYPYRDIL